MIRNNIYNLHNKVNLSFILSFFFQTYDYFSLVRGIHPTTSILRVVDGYNLHVHTTGYGMGYTLYKHVYSTLLAVERNKPRTSILLVGERETPVHIHISCGAKGYSLHVHTACGRNGHTLHVHTAITVCKDTPCTMHIHSGCIKGIHSESPYTVATGVKLPVMLKNDAGMMEKS
jgi:hypothetical protein